MAYKIWRNGDEFLIEGDGRLVLTRPEAEQLAQELLPQSAKAALTRAEKRQTTTPEQRDAIVTQMWAQGASARKIGDAVGWARTSVLRRRIELGLEARLPPNPKAIAAMQAARRIRRIK